MERRHTFGVEILHKEREKMTNTLEREQDKDKLLIFSDTSAPNSPNIL